MECVLIKGRQSRHGMIGDHAPTKIAQAAGAGGRQVTNRQLRRRIASRRPAYVALEEHLVPGGCILDKKIDGKGVNPDEQAADRFAIELLTGDPGKKIRSIRGLNVPTLAREALKYGIENKIDPTHVATNYGHTANRFAVASTAVTLISKGTPTDQELIREMARDHLDLEEIKEDDLIAIARMTGGV